jgi:hypothetical protein
MIAYIHHSYRHPPPCGYGLTIHSSALIALTSVRCRAAVSMPWPEQALAVMISSALCPPPVPAPLAAHHPKRQHHHIAIAGAGTLTDFSSIT